MSREDMRFCIDGTSALKPDYRQARRPEVRVISGNGRQSLRTPAAIDPDNHLTKAQAVLVYVIGCLISFGTLFMTI